MMRRSEDGTGLCRPLAEGKPLDDDAKCSVTAMLDAGAFLHVVWISGRRRPVDLPMK